MNGYQITTFLTLDEWTSKIYRGIVMVDSYHELNWFKNKHAASLYILNADVETGRGKHWCVAYKGKYLENTRILFFDPYGLSPSFYGFDKLLHEYKLKVEYTNECVQSIGSNVCGYHCLFFAYFISRGYSIGDIISMYAEDNRENDKMVREFVVQFGDIYKI